jgi:hypothetical protein
MGAGRFLWGDPAQFERAKPFRADQRGRRCRPVAIEGPAADFAFSAADEIEKLERLKNAGTISDDEYTRLRARIRAITAPRACDRPQAGRTRRRRRSCGASQIKDQSESVTLL